MLLLRPLSAHRVSHRHRACAHLACWCAQYLSFVLALLLHFFFCNLPERNHTFLCATLFISNWPSIIQTQDAEERLLRDLADLGLTDVKPAELYAALRVLTGYI